MSNLELTAFNLRYCSKNYPVVRDKDGKLYIHTREDLTLLGDGFIEVRVFNHNSSTWDVATREKVNFELIRFNDEMYNVILL